MFACALCNYYLSICLRVIIELFISKRNLLHYLHLYFQNFHYFGLQFKFDYFLFNSLFCYLPLWIIVYYIPQHGHHQNNATAYVRFLLRFSKFISCLSKLILKFHSLHHFSCQVLQKYIEYRSQTYNRPMRFDDNFFTVCRTCFRLISFFIFLIILLCSRYKVSRPELRSLLLWRPTVGLYRRTTQSLTIAIKYG